MVISLLGFKYIFSISAPTFPGFSLKPLLTTGLCLLSLLWIKPAQEFQLRQEIEGGGIELSPGYPADQQRQHLERNERERLGNVYVKELDLNLSFEP